MGKADFGSLLTVSAFRYLWLNQFLTQIAYNTLNFALIIWVYKLTNSNFAVSVVILCFYLPSLLFGVFGGLLADIVDKKKILLVVDLLYALSYLAFIPIRKIYPLIVVNTFFLNSLSQFFIPAESSAIPLVVANDRLFLANSLFSLTLYTSLLVGFTSAGPILTHMGISAVFLIGFISQVTGFLMILKLPEIKATNLSLHSRKFLADLHKRDSLLSGVLIKDVFFLAKEETKQTFDYIKGKLSLSVAIGLLAAGQAVVGTLAVLVPSYLERVLRIHATDASYFLMMPLGAGMIIGALFIGKIGLKLPKRFLVIPAIIAAGLIFFLIGATPTIAKTVKSVSEELSADLPIHKPNLKPSLPMVKFPRLRYFNKVPTVSSLFAIGAFILGMCTVSIIVPSQTEVQEETDERVRGKIMSVMVILMNALSVFPVLLAGALADIFGVATVFTLMGVGVFVIGLLAFKPARFFKSSRLPLRYKQFLGLGHWQ